jgi:ABC-type transport system involved in cytochrome bd biosynthesis fused ATPase/permease subunit
MTLGGNTIEVSGAAFEMVPVSEPNIVDPHLSPTKRKARNISWSDVNFVVKEKTKVLSGCWGEVKAGQVMAVMGPSGSGKSSLLNVLAGRSSSTTGIVVEGNVRILLYLYLSFSFLSCLSSIISFRLKLVAILLIL